MKEVNIVFIYEFITYARAKYIALTVLFLAAV